MTMKEYTAFTKLSALLETPHQIVSCHIQDICWGSLTTILHPQPAGSVFTLKSMLKPNLEKEWKFTIHREYNYQIYQCIRQLFNLKKYPPKFPVILITQYKMWTLNHVVYGTLLAWVMIKNNTNAFYWTHLP